MTLRPLDDQGPPTHGMNRLTSSPVEALRNQVTGAEIPLLPDRRYVLGKSPSCDVVVPDACVSRMHCVLERRRGALYVRDNGSRNGTFINHRRVECGELTPGSELTVGTTRFLALGARGGPAPSALATLVGRDPVFRQALDHARRAALTDVNVMVIGETGTGKELVAQSIHETSRRSREPFVAVNCGGIPRELIGSELFGHERGAFTGALAEREGVFVQADRGTLFLDELGELPIEQQPHLLRALESRMIRRVGGAVERPVDVRLISATNRTAGLGTERGRLRVDLFHRVATVLISLPPLRARLGDLDLLCSSILDDLAAKHGVRRLSDRARRVLREHTWPGNVRELRQSLMRAAALSTSIIDAEHLFPPSVRRVTAISQDGGGAPHAPGEIPLSPDRLPRLEVAVRDLYSDALTRHGSIRAAAQALGVPKSTFADKAKRYGLAVPGRARK